VPDVQRGVPIVPCRLTRGPGKADRDGPGAFPGAGAYLVLLGMRGSASSESAKTHGAPLRKRRPAVDGAAPGNAGGEAFTSAADAARDRNQARGRRAHTPGLLRYWLHLFPCPIKLVPRDFPPAAVVVRRICGLRRILERGTGGDGGHCDCRGRGGGV